MGTLSAPEARALRITTSRAVGVLISSRTQTCTSARCSRRPENSGARHPGSRRLTSTRPAFIVRQSAFRNGEGDSIFRALEC
jgi:hypothetical protein